MILRDDLARLDELRRYDLVEQPEDAELDRLAELAARVCGAPMALISFIDDREQRFLGRFGVEGQMRDRLPIEESLCALALDRPASVMVIEDIFRHERASALALVRNLGLRFYAGAPLVSPSGYTLGTVCVFDRRQHPLDDDARRALALVRDETMQLLETRRTLVELRRSESLRQEAVEALMAIKHDLMHRIELRTREVEEAHHKTRQLLERIGDGFVALDGESRFVYVNQRAAQIIGRPSEQFIGKHLFSEFPEQTGRPFHEAYERARREQVMTSLESESPAHRWFEVRIYPSASGVAIFFTEITERKSFEAALELSNRRLVDAQRVAHVGSWEWDVAGNVVTWSDELYRVYGLPVGSPLGGYEDFLGRVHPDDLERTKQVIATALGSGTAAAFAYDHRIVRPDGSVRVLQTRGEVVVDGGRPARLIGCCWDVTDRHEAVTALKRTVALLQATLEVTSDGLLVCDGGGNVTSYNAQLATLLALPKERGGASPSLATVAGRLRDPQALLARARTLAPGDESCDTWALADGRLVEARSRPQRVEGEVAGRVWSFRPTASP